MSNFQMPSMPALGQSSQSLEELLSQATPDELAQILGGGGAADDKQKILEKQMQQAQALRGPSHADQATTATGAQLGGIADTISALGSGFGQYQATKGMQGVSDARTHGQQTLIDLLRRKQGGGGDPLASLLGGGTLDGSGSIPEGMS